jgi:formimidoylglutamate deiminase
VTREVIEADLTWIGDEFQRGVQVAIGDDGRIEGVGKLDRKARRLHKQALLPGFISAHSHAFQRALRGRGETFPAGSGSFWSWREAMYELVASLDAHRFYEETRAAYEEMRAAGITTVGEFHYLHHSPHDHDYAFDDLVLRAAKDAGIRIVLLMTYYKTGGINRALSAAQKRFETRSIEEFFARVDALRATTDRDLQTIGIAAHSIRGVPLDELLPLYQEARKRGMPFHMHLEEQRRELEECVSAFNKTPLQLILERFESCEGFVAVHATHSHPTRMRHFLGRGGSVCITPLTEANLGDGIPDVSVLDDLCLGTDSNARISMIEEMRWLEYGQRLVSERRGRFRDAKGRVSPRLLHFATAAGARALDINAGRITAGAAADFVAVDAQELDAIIFGASENVIRATCVAGNWR